MRIVLNISDKVTQRYLNNWYNDIELISEVINDLTLAVAKQLDCSYEINSHSKNIIDFK